MQDMSAQDEPPPAPPDYSTIEQKEAGQRKCDVDSCMFKFQSIAFLKETRIPYHIVNA